MSPMVIGALELMSREGLEKFINCIPGNINIVEVHPTSRRKAGYKKRKKLNNLIIINNVLHFLITACPTLLFKRVSWLTSKQNENKNNSFIYC